MTPSILSIRTNHPLRKMLPIALSMGALILMSARAHADNIEEVTVTAPAAVKTIGYDSHTAAPIKETTVTARVTVDSIGLTTNSGVALLEDSVRDAARKACDAADPYTPDDGDCFRAAVKAAQPEVTAAIARARSSSNS